MNGGIGQLKFRAIHFHLDLAVPIIAVKLVSIDDYQEV